MMRLSSSLDGRGALRAIAGGSALYAFTLQGQ